MDDNNSSNRYDRKSLVHVSIHWLLSCHFYPHVGCLKTILSWLRQYSLYQLLTLLTTFPTSILSLKQTETKRKSRMFGITCQEEFLRTDAFKFRKKGVRLKVCLCIYFLSFYFFVTKKGKKKRERKTRQKLLLLEINPQTSCLRREALLRQESRTNFEIITCFLQLDRSRPYREPWSSLANSFKIRIHFIGLDFLPILINFPSTVARSFFDLNEWI